MKLEYITQKYVDTVSNRLTVQNLKYVKIAGPEEAMGHLTWILQANIYIYIYSLLVRR